jgi:hypothetical protein
MLIAEKKLLLGEWFDVRPEQAVELIDWAGQVLGVEVRSDIPDAKIELQIRDLFHRLTLEGISAT